MSKGILKRKGNWGFFKREVIEDENGTPYIRRWRILETPWFGIFIHHIMRSDTDRDLHDHPWSFVTFLLHGEYVEEEQRNNRPTVSIKRRQSPCMVKHSALDFHRISLKKDGMGKPKPVWTLFITGPKWKHWGFLTSEGWVHNKNYNDNKRLK